MKTRGLLNEEEEALFSKGEADIDLDIAYSAPQNHIARTDFLITTSDFASIFSDWHFSGIVLHFFHTICKDNNSQNTFQI